MARVIITLKIMPEGTDVDFNHIKLEAEQEITEFGASVERVEVEEVAFGLKALKIFFIMNESVGSTEDLERRVSEINGVNSVQVIDVRRAIG